MFYGGLIPINLSEICWFTFLPSRHMVKGLAGFSDSVSESIILSLTPFILRLSSRNIILIDSLKTLCKVGLPINHLLTVEDT